MFNDEFAKEVLKKQEAWEKITADSAEPKSIDELKRFGLNVSGAEKGKDSVKFGIKSLQKLAKIVIDKERCPNVAREFLSYEFDKNRDGEWKSDYPDRDNHGIDAVRYGLEKDFKAKVSILDVIK